MPGPLCLVNLGRGFESCFEDSGEPVESVKQGVDIKRHVFLLRTLWRLDGWGQNLSQVPLLPSSTPD